MPIGSRHRGLIQFAHELGVDTIQLSAAFHPSESDVPAAAMLDPVANTLDLREPFDAARARRVERTLDATGLALSDIGYFDNMLHHDAAFCGKKHAFMQRACSTPPCSSASMRLRVRQAQRRAHDGPEPSGLRRSVRAAACLGEGTRLDLPGRAVPDARMDHRRQLSQQHRLRAGRWIALHRICEKHGVGDQFRIHYDPSHAILMGQDSRSIFQYLRDTGITFSSAGFTSKAR